MNDHVESLQLDLNSIKDFLTSTSFNSIDSYTINNVNFYFCFCIRAVIFYKFSKQKQEHFSIEYRKQ
jgi:hypothetical protein